MEMNTNREISNCVLRRIPKRTTLNSGYQRLNLTSSGRESSLDCRLESERTETHFRSRFNTRIRRSVEVTLPGKMVQGAHLGYVFFVLTSAL